MRNCQGDRYLLRSTKQCHLDTTELLSFDIVVCLLNFIKILIKCQSQLEQTRRLATWHYIRNVRTPFCV